MVLANISNFILLFVWEFQRAARRCLNAHTHAHKKANGSLQSFIITIGLDDGGKMNNTLKPKDFVILELHCHVSIMPSGSATSFCSLIKLVHLKPLLP